MQPTSILAMLLAGAAMTVAAPSASPPTYNSGNEMSPVNGGGQGYYPGGNGGSGSGGSGSGGSGSGGNGGNGGSGSGSGGSGSGQPFYCAQSNGLQGSPQCCQTNILGVASLTCSPPQSSLFTQQEFSESCAQNGRVASCCVLPAAGLGVACQDIATGQSLN